MARMLPFATAKLGIRKNDDYTMSLARYTEENKVIAGMGKDDTVEVLRLYTVVIHHPAGIKQVYVLAPNADEAIDQALYGMKPTDEEAKTIPTQAHRLPMRIRGWGTNEF